jgi:quercetin dioxygenase-like cupin family protein
MFSSGQTIENSVTGERMTFLQTASETDGECVVVEVVVRPGGAVATPHVHPNQSERFEVLEGEVTFHVGRERVTLAAGDVATIPAGTPHAFQNAGSADATFRCEVRPALHFEQLVAAFFALAEDGRTNDRGMPGFLQMAVIADAYADTGIAAFPPPLVQRLGLALLAPLGRLCGYRADGGLARRSRTIAPEASTLAG